VLAWYNIHDNLLKKHFQLDIWRALISSMEERFINMEEEKENLWEMNK
jgi:hypothetical protein